MTVTADALAAALREESEHDEDDTQPPPPKCVYSYDEFGRLRGEWWPHNDSYVRISHVNDGR